MEKNNSCSAGSFIDFVDDEIRSLRIQIKKHPEQQAELTKKIERFEAARKNYLAKFTKRENGTVYEIR